MRRRKSIILLLMMTVICTGIFAGCKKKTVSEPADKTQVTESTEENDTVEKTESTTEVENIEDAKAEDEKEATTEVEIYGINEESLESEPAHATISGEITPEAIVMAVVDDYKAKSIDIGIYEVKQEDNKVIVSFENGKAPLADVGSDVEETILNCISDSLMDNLDFCEAVIFRKENESYESGHFAFDFDEVYASE